MVGADDDHIPADGDFPSEPLLRARLGSPQDRLQDPLARSRRDIASDVGGAAGPDIPWVAQDGDVTEQRH